MPIKSIDTGTDLPIAKVCYGSAESLGRQPRRRGFDKNWRAVQNKTTNSCPKRTRRLHQIRFQKGFDHRIRVGLAINPDLSTSDAECWIPVPRRRSQALGDG